MAKKRIYETRCEVLNFIKSQNKLIINYEGYGIEIRCDKVPNSKYIILKHNGNSKDFKKFKIIEFTEE